MRPVAVLTAAALAGTLLGGCGDQVPASSTSDGWRTERLVGDPATDFPTVLATDGDDALVLIVSDEGVLQSHVSVDGADFEPGEPLATGERYVELAGAVRLGDGSWYAVGSGGVVRADGDDEMVFEPVAFRSVDGLTWEPVGVVGFADAVEPSDVEVVGGSIVVVGSYRTEDQPSMGGFEAHAWVSEDGVVYDEVALPGVPEYRNHHDESNLGSLVTSDDGLLAAGRVGRHAALWRSTDGGRSWQEVGTPALAKSYAVSGMHAVGSTVVASLSAADAQAIRSDDGGRTWRPVDALPVNEETDGWAPLWAGGGRFFTLTGIDDTSWSRPEVCYADLAQCGRSPGPSLVASEDGASWTAIDTDALGEIDVIAGTDDGRVLVLTGEGGALSVHAWPAGTDLPEADRPAVPETVELVTLPDGERPEVGVGYHHPLYTHCGIDWVWFGDGTWRRTDDGPEYETGAGDGAPEGWPVPEDGGNVYGYATVLEDGTLEYTAEDGTVIATYEREGGAPACA